MRLSWFIHCALLILVLVGLPRLVHAFEPLNTDDAGTIGKSVNQIEAYFYSLRNFAPGDPGSTATPGEEFRGDGNAKAFPFTYTYGISETTEIAFSTTYYATPRGSYSPFSNNIISLKWRFWGDGESGLGMAIKPAITLPASTSQQVQGLGLAKTNYELNYIISYYWEEIEVHSNISYARNPYNSNFPISGSYDPYQINLVSGSIAPIWNVNSWLKLALDIGSSINTSTNGAAVNDYAMVAAIFSVTKNVDIGLSFLQSGTTPNNAWTGKNVAANRSEIGVTWRF
ncbi:hypothetical protein [Polynucleobacter acidiphobus]|uniref:hypothetical protein n=1 Tax=Polynucleobacter acidiphobus TaxID=556053 RepID=UPI000D3899B2|nr:hypothetical protein [Polynucleobacter acidiphobus]